MLIQTVAKLTCPLIFAWGHEPFGLLPSATAAQRELVSHLREIDTVGLEPVDHASPDVLTRCHQTFSRCAVDRAWQRCWTSNNNAIRKSCYGTRTRLFGGCGHGDLHSSRAQSANGVGLAATERARRERHVLSR